MWENCVGMMDVDAIDHLEPDSWEDGTPKMPCVPYNVHR